MCLIYIIQVHKLDQHTHIYISIVSGLSLQSLLFHFSWLGQAYGRGLGTPGRPYFSFINDVEELDEDQLAVVDTANHCVRNVSRTTGRAEALAGRCGLSGVFEGTVPAKEANLTSPIRAISDKEKNVLYYLIYAPEPRIVLHNLTTGQN